MQELKSIPVLAKTTGFAHPGRNATALGIEPGMNVADFGAGSGAYTFAIAEALYGSGHVYAVDVQRDLLQRVKNEATRRGLKNVEVIWGDLEAEGGSKLQDKSVDLVLISNVLFQLADKHFAVREASRILKPMKRLVIIDWSDSFRGMGPPQQDVVQKKDAEKLAQSAGFELVREFPAGEHHYGLVFRRK